MLGFVLEDNQDLQQRIIDGALDDIPVLGQTLSENPASLNGNIWALLIGLALALWSATKAFVALQGAQDDVWEVDVDDRDAMPKVRGKALLGLLIIGGAQIGSIVITTLVAAADLPNGGRILLTAATIVINIAVIFAMFKYLVSASLPWRTVWPGAIVGGLAYTLLQQFGTMIVQRITEQCRRHLRPVRSGPRSRDVAEPPGHRHAHELRVQRALARRRATSQASRPDRDPERGQSSASG